VFDLLAPFFGLVALGFAAGRLLPRPEGPAGLAWMQFFVVYVALPCLFFRLLADRPVEQFFNGRFVLATTLATATAFLLSFAVGRVAGGSVPEATVQGAAGAYSNVGYMGPPLVLAAFGEEAASPVLLVFVFDNLLLFTLVPLLMGAGGADRRPPLAVLAAALRRVATHPFNIAVTLGLIAGTTGLKLPVALDRIVGWLAPAAAPCALFMLGVSVALHATRRVPREVPALVAIKLVLHPLVAAGLLWLIGGAPPTWVAAGIAMAALPPALNIFIISAQYRVGLERASACILVGTLAATVTLSAALWLLHANVR
jgi:malonate transporter and related proteins